MKRSPRATVLLILALGSACAGSSMGIGPGDGGGGAGPDGPSATGGTGGTGDRDAAAADTSGGDLASADTGPVTDLPPALHACTKAGMVMRCQVSYPIGLPQDTLDCTCQCFPPDAPLTRPACDPAEFTCCGWRANSEICHCANQNYITRVSQSCDLYRNTDMPVTTCP